MLTNQRYVTAAANAEKGKGRFFSAAAVLISLIIAIIVGWFLLQLLQFLATLILAATLFISIKALPSKRKTYSADEKKKTLRQKLLEIAKESKKKSDPEAQVDEKTTSSFLNILLVIIWTVILVWVVIVTGSLAIFALNSRFQIYPLNLLSLVAVVVSFKDVINVLTGYYKVMRLLDEPQKDQTLANYLLTKVKSLIIGGYIAGVFLVMFGVIH